MPRFTQAEQEIIRRWCVAVARSMEGNFGAPFLPDGFVEVEAREDSLSFWIGRRDAEYGYDGKYFGTGTYLQSPWDIRQRRREGRS